MQSDTSKECEEKRMYHEEKRMYHEGFECMFYSSIFSMHCKLKVWSYGTPEVQSMDDRVG